jgi:hypothetical protein
MCGAAAGTCANPDKAKELAMPKQGGAPSTKWTGTKGNDTAIVSSNEALAQTSYDGGAGYDTLDLSGLASGVSIYEMLGNPANSAVWPNSPFSGSWWETSFTGPLFRDSIKNFEKIVGTDFGDYIDLSGGTVARVVDGGAGDDAIYMGSSTGSNTAIGATGSDQLFGNRNGDLLVGGTYDGNVVQLDGTPDEFSMYSGTIRDFEAGIDRLVIDAGNLPGQTTSATWVDVTTSYGPGARLTIAADRVITVIGVTAATMNASENGYIRFAQGGELTSGAGDDLILGTATRDSVDRFIFPAGSGDDYLVGFDRQNDTLVFEDEPSWSMVDHHGEQTLLATYDAGTSSVLLVGFTLDDLPAMQVDLI